MSLSQTTRCVMSAMVNCRDAKREMMAVSVELTQLSGVVNTLQASSAAENEGIPPARQEQIIAIIADCKAVLAQLDTLVGGHVGKRGTVRWSVPDKREVGYLKQLLMAYRWSLDLAAKMNTMYGHSSCHVSPSHVMVFGSDHV